MIAEKQVIHPHFITDNNGKKESVILSINEYSDLLEEISDLVAVVERKDEPTISHEEFVKELKRDGYL